MLVFVGGCTNLKKSFEFLKESNWFFIAYHICSDIMLALLWNCGFGVINIASNYDDGFKRPNTFKETTFFSLRIIRYDFYNLRLTFFLPLF